LDIYREGGWHKYPQKAAVVSGKSAAQIVREALAVELEKDDYKGD